MKLISTAQAKITLDQILFLVLMIKKREAFGLSVKDELQSLFEYVEKEIGKLEEKAILDINHVFKPRDIA